MNQSSAGYCDEHHDRCCDCDEYHNDDETLS